MSSGWRFLTLYRRQRSRPSPRKRNLKGKWLSEKALQTAVKRRGAKRKRQKERYTLPSAEFQRTARREKTAVLSQHCKERKTTEWERLDLSKKIRDTKGTFHAKMGTI